MEKPIEPKADVERVPAVSHVSGAHVPAHGGAHHPETFLKTLKSGAIAIVAIVVLVVFLAYIVGVKIPGIGQAAPPDDRVVKEPVLGGVSLVEGQPSTLEVPEQVRVALGIRKGGKDRIATVKPPTATRPLVLFGSTALDPTRLVRVRARFAPAEVVEIGEHLLSPGETRSGKSEGRELRPGDRVSKGDALGTFFSVDVGNKKRDLIDALVQLDLDQKILDAVEKNRAAVPEVYYLSKVRDVQTDRNAVNRALNNLLVWNIPQEEIDELQDEAAKVSADKDAWYKTREGRWVQRKKGPATATNPDEENKNPWGRVTLRAPFSGVIVERNVTVHEIVQDPTTNLFQIAQVDRLLVIAYAPEDELPTLNALKQDQRVWTIRTVGPRAVAGIKGPIEEIGYLIDPNQHTAIIKGYIDNPKELIRAGQFVTATIEVPPPEDVVEVPIDAIVEDGRNCVVFVETDAAKHYYTMRRVHVTQRFEWSAFVRSVSAFSGATTTGAKVVVNVSRPSALAVGQTVVGPGIPADTLITAVGDDATITLSKAVMATSAKVALEAEIHDKHTQDEKDLNMLPKLPLRPGERILRSGVGELKAALIELESNPKKAARSE